MKKAGKQNPPSKPSSVSLEIELAEPLDGPGTLSVKPDGSFVMTDRHGQEVALASTTRSISYERPKGPKVRSRLAIDGGKVSLGGVAELTRFDRVVVVDTNRLQINGEDVCASAFLNCKFVSGSDRVMLTVPDERLHIYELHNAAGNPEMLAILLISISPEIQHLLSAGKRVAVVTDSELNLLQAIGSRAAPVYGKYLLPKNVSLLYASGDSAQETINKLIRFCDQQSTRYLRALKEGKVPTDPKLQSVLADEAVRYRYMYESKKVEVVNPLLQGPTMGPNTKIKVRWR